MRILVLFNLRKDVDSADYEAWSVSEDCPTVRSLPSIDAFRVYALTGLLMGDGKPPFAYAEIIDVGDAEGFGRDVATPRMQAIAAKFQAFADNPLFITTREIGA
jgi:hypothetical protein